MIRRLTLVAAMSALNWTAPASAQGPDNDVRCLTTSKFFASTEKDPQKKQLAVASAFFFLGRIDARLSPAQIKAQLVAPGALIKQSEAGALMNDCAKRVQLSQRSLMMIGQTITSRPGKK